MMADILLCRSMLVIELPTIDIDIVVRRNTTTIKIFEDM